MTAEPGYFIAFWSYISCFHTSDPGHTATYGKSDMGYGGQSPYGKHQPSGMSSMFLTYFSNFVLAMQVISHKINIIGRASKNFIKLLKHKPQKSTCK